MDDHPALAVARRYFDVYASGDHDAIAACLTDDVVWVIHGHHAGPRASLPISPEVDRTGPDVRLEVADRYLPATATTCVVLGRVAATAVRRARSCRLASRRRGAHACRPHSGSSTPTSRPSGFHGLADVRVWRPHQVRQTLPGITTCRRPKRRGARPSHPVAVTASTGVARHLPRDGRGHRGPVGADVCRRPVDEVGNAGLRRRGLGHRTGRVVDSPRPGPHHGGAAPLLEGLTAGGPGRRAAWCGTASIRDPARYAACTAYRAYGDVIGEFSDRLTARSPPPASRSAPYREVAARLRFQSLPGPHGDLLGGGGGGGGRGGGGREEWGGRGGGRGPPRAGGGGLPPLVPVRRRHLRGRGRRGERRHRGLDEGRPSGGLSGSPTTRPASARPCRAAVSHNRGLATSPASATGGVRGTSCSGSSGPRPSTASASTAGCLALQRGASPCGRSS